MIDARQNTVRTIARRLFEKVGDFTKVSSILRLADQKYREGLIDEALQLVSGPEFDRHLDAWRIRGNAFGKKANYPEAIRAFDAILSERPTDFLAHFHLGIFCYRSGDFRRSVHHYEIADRLSPNHPTIQSDLPAARERLRAADSS